MLRCARCRERLLSTKTEAGISYLCGRCQGRAVSFAVLRKMTTPGHVKGLFRHAKQAQQTRNRFGLKCPVCEKSMAPVHVPVEDQQIELDVCIGCQFVWFDPSELEQLPKPSPPPVEPKKEMSAKTKEALAMAQIESVERKAQWQTDEPDDPWKWIPGLLGMPVEYEGTSLRAIPWVTWVASATIVLIFLVTMGHLDEAVNQFGLIPAVAERLGGATFLTSFFLHASWGHLLGNVYFLLVFGDNVEEYVGRLKFGLLLVLATFVGCLCHCIGDPRSTLPLVGASGGISGVIVFYALAFPKARLGILLSYWWHFRWVYFPASLGLVAWAGLQCFHAWHQLEGIGHVSALGHLGGAAIGFVAWFLWRQGREDDTLFSRSDDFTR